jgi:hypothetical protein
MLAPLVSPALDVAKWDLKLDWRINENPNGPWSLREDTLVMPAQIWTDIFAFTNSQPAFHANGPVWIFNTAPAKSANQDWDVGDILVHSQDGNVGQGHGQANVAWTSPINGTVNIGGFAWMGREEGRASNSWKIFVRGSPVTEGLVYSGDQFSRTNPIPFEFGFGGTNSLRNIPVSVGDQIVLEVRRASFYGDYTGLNLIISQTVPDPGLTVQVGCVRTCFATASNAWYQLQYSTNLGSGSWFSITSLSEGNGNERCLEDPTVPDQPTRYYRVFITNGPPAAAAYH